MLKPLARFCIQQGLTVQNLLEACKQALINAAREDISHGHKKLNISRLSVATGIHRRDVMRLTSEQAQAPIPGTLMSRLIGQWEKDPRFQTKTGQARVLTCEGDNNEFRRLVNCVSKDLNPGTVLFELERIAAVERTLHGVRLKKKAFSIRDDALQCFQLLSKDIADLMSAVQENVSSQRRVPHLQARTEYDNVSKKALPVIKEWLINEGAVFHARARDFISRFDKDLNPALEEEGGARVVVSTFSRVSGGEK